MSSSYPTPTFSTVDITGNMTISGAVTVSGAVSAPGGVSGNATITGGTATLGQASVGSPLVIVGGNTAPGDPNQGAQIDIHNTNSTISGGNIFHLRADANNGFEILGNAYTGLLTLTQAGQLTSNVSTASLTPLGANTANTVAQRAAWHVYPEDYGAHGDGVTDDLGAFNAALASAASGVLHLNPKVYYIGSGNLSVPSGWTVEGGWSPGANGTGGQPLSTKYVILLNPLYSVLANSMSRIAGVLIMGDNALVTTPQTTITECVQLSQYLDTTAAGQGVTIPNAASDMILERVGIFGFNIGIGPAAGATTGAGRMRLSDVHIDANTGIIINGAYDNPFFSNVRVHPYLTTSATTVAAPVWSISAVADASGLVQVTVGTQTSGSTPFPYINGTTIVIGGATTSGGLVLNGRWTISNVNSGAGTFTLVGSTFTGAWTSGGSIYVNGYQRFGAAFSVSNITGLVTDGMWSFGHDIGFYAGTNCAWWSGVNAGVDNLDIPDPTTIGWHISGTSLWTRIVGGSTSSQGTPILCDTTSTGFNTIASTMIGGNNTGPLISAQSGALAISACQLQSGVIDVGNSITRFLVDTSNDLSGTVFSFAGIAARNNTYLGASLNSAQGNTSTGYQQISSQNGYAASIVLDATQNAGGHSWALASTTNGQFTIADNTGALTAIFINDAGFNTKLPLYFGGTYNPYIQTSGPGLEISTPLTVAGALSSTSLSVTLDPGFVPNVVTHGADPTGINDSSAAFIAAAATGRIVVPPGTFKLTATVNVPINCVVVGARNASVINVDFAGAAFTINNASVSEQFSAFFNLSFVGQVSGAIGISATNANNLDVYDCTFEGCSGGSVILTNCNYYSVRDNKVTSSASFVGGSISLQGQSSTVISKFAQVRDNKFSALLGSAFGLAAPCIYVQNVASVKVKDNTLDWGVYGGGPIDFIHILDQCQDVEIATNSALGVANGIVIAPSATYNVMPSYVTLSRNVIDSFGTSGIAINGTSADVGNTYELDGNQCTQPQQICTGAVVSSGGTGYAVGNVLTGPTPGGAQEGAAVILQVSSVGTGGVITGVTIYNGGLTQAPPTNPVTFTGGAGTGATFTLTFAAPGNCMQFSYVNQITGDGNFVGSYDLNVGTGFSFTYVGYAQFRGSILSNLANGVNFADTNSANVRFAPDTLFQTITNDVAGTPPSTFYSFPVRGQIYSYQQNFQETSTAGVTLAGADFVNYSLLSRSGPTADFTDTTDTATNIIDAFPQDSRLSPMTNRLRLLNYSAVNWTIVPGTGVTIGGTATIPSGMFADVLVQISGPSSVNIDIIGTGAISWAENIGNAAFTGAAINVSGNATVGGALGVTGAATISGALTWQGSVTGVPATEAAPTVVSGTWYQNTSGGPQWVAVNAQYASGSGATLYTAPTTSSTTSLVDAYTNAGNTKELVLSGLIPTGWWWIYTATAGVTISPSGNPNGAYRVM